MFNLSGIIPEISTFRKMKILGSGLSISKYRLKDICEPFTFYVILNHFDVVQGLDQISDAPVLFFAHDFCRDHFDAVIARTDLRTHLQRDNVYTFLHRKTINHRQMIKTIDYPADRLTGIKNLTFYEKAQSNIKYFESTTTSLLGISSSLHSPLSLPVGNEFIDEVHLYGLDMYIYQQSQRFDHSDLGGHANIIFNANKILLNYLCEKRPDLKIKFFN
jgi:hypothetical protein